MTTFLPRVDDLAARYRRLARYGPLPEDAEGLLRILSPPRSPARAARINQHRRVAKIRKSPNITEIARRVRQEIRAGA